MRRLIGSLLFVALAPPLQAQSAALVSQVSGRVLAAGTGEPIGGAAVTLNPAQLAPPPAGRATPPPPPPLQNPLSRRQLLTSQTNSDGVFDISSVPQGRWRVQVQREGYVMLGALTSPIVIEVGGTRVTVPDIRIDRGGTITGRVLDARGRPITGVAVLAMQQIKSPDGTVRTLGSGSGGETNDLGEFRLPGLAPGQHYVIAQPRPNTPIAARGATPPAANTTFVATYYPGFPDAAAASPVTVTRGVTTSGIEFSMVSVRAYRVSGVVVDSMGRLVAGAVVRLAQPRVSFSTMNQVTTASDGTFRIANVPDGRYAAVAAIPAVARTGNSLATAVSFAPPNAGTEIVVQGADVTDVRLVATEP